MTETAQVNLNVGEVVRVTQSVIGQVEQAIVGKRAVLDQIMAALLAGGHVLIEDYPGLAKTLIASSFATALGITFRRIQFTPDLLPGDITGGYIFNRAQNEFVLRQGPIFANIILADEINRASPRTQSALLEAMQEFQVTLEGETRRLPQPFMVIATQNPIEYEGTFPLPEAQLDRFIMKLAVGYPSADEEQEVLKRRRERRHDAVDLQPVTDADGLLRIREIVEQVYVDPDIERYIVDLTRRTRSYRQVAVGASPRGSLALLKLARAGAAMQGRNYILPDDIKAFAGPALSHRLILEPDLWTFPHAAAEIVADLVKTTPVPVIETR
ncbi:MAG: MoxR family ATPase [Chloroflexi bacterium]|nr:MoxR family ATPase [Chloroflexota bacterium]